MILDAATLAQGMAALAAIDSDFAAAIARFGVPELRRWPTGFGTLVDVIIGQQVSGASAAAIRTKLRAAITPFDAEHVLAASDETLRNVGLSRQKMAYLRDLAGHVVKGTLEIDRLDMLPDETVLEQLIAVKGIGPWTAEIYLLFALGRPDIWPAEDLALQVGVQHVKNLDERPSGKATRIITESWSPWRGVAAHFLWHAYHQLTRRDAIGKSPSVAPNAKSAVQSFAKRGKISAKPKISVKKMTRSNPTSRQKTSR